jgi:hypothetical protein
VRNRFRLMCILLSLAASAQAQKVVVAGVSTAGQCQYALAPLLSDLNVIGFPGDWTIVVACTPGVWNYIQAKADARATRTAFTNLNGHITVVNAAIYLEPLPLRGTTHRTPRLVLLHERGHIVCGCADEIKADEAAGAGG